MKKNKNIFALWEPHYNELPQIFKDKYKNVTEIVSQDVYIANKYECPNLVTLCSTHYHEEADKLYVIKDEKLSYRKLHEVLYKQSNFYGKFYKTMKAKGDFDENFLVMDGTPEEQAIIRRKRERELEDFMKKYNIQQ